MRNSSAMFVRTLVVIVVLLGSSSTVLSQSGGDLFRPKPTATPNRDASSSSRWRSPRLSPSLISIMDSRYLQLCFASEGYVRSGVPLVGYVNGKLIPAGLSDDLGIYLFIPLIGKLFHIGIPASIDLFFGCAIALGFLIGAAGLFFCGRTARGRTFSAIALLCLLLLTVAVGDVYAVQSAFAAAVVPWAIYLFRDAERLQRTASVLSLASGLGFVSYIVNTIRMQAGTACLLFVAIIVLTMRIRISRRILVTAAIVPGLLLGMWMSTAMIHRRDQYLATQLPNYQPAIPHHATWHTIYIGLGYLQNDYGISYSDSVSFSRVQSVDPHAEYLSAEYERILKSSVFAFVRANPKFVINSLFAKVGVLLLTFLLCANIGLIQAIRHPASWRFNTAFCVALSFTALPALLAVPKLSYMLGFVAFSTLYGIISVDHAFWLKSSHVARN